MELNTLLEGTLQHMKEEVYTYVIFFSLSLLFALILNGLLLRFLKNISQHRKQHEETLVRWASQTKPAIGGIGFFLVFLLSVCAYYILPFGTLPPTPHQLLGLLGCVSIGFITGLVDDSYNTPPRFKLIGQFFCAALLIATGIYINISDSFLLNALFTTVWVIGIMNAVNMIDNMDGISTTTALTAVCTALVSLYINGGGRSFYTIILLGTLAALLAFLYYNKYPSKMYMGDAGSQFLGAFLSFFSIALLWNWQPAPFSNFLNTLLLPTLAFMLPIMDTTTVTLRRLAAGRSPFQGGRDHTTHYLVYAGLRDSQVALLFALIGVFNIFLATVLLYHSHQWTAYKTLLVIFYFIVVFAALQYTYKIGKLPK